METKHEPNTHSRHTKRENKKEVSNNSCLPEYGTSKTKLPVELYSGLFLISKLVSAFEKEKEKKEKNNYNLTL